MSNKTIGGTVLLTPAIIAPRSRVANKLIPLGIETFEGSEYILTQFAIAVGAIKDYTILFRNYVKTVITNNALAQMLLTTLGDIPLKYAIAVKYESLDIFELDTFLDSLGFRKVTTLEVENIRDLVRKYASLVTTKYRVYEIRPLPFVLVYSPTQKILTRLCWLEDIKGHVELYTAKQVNVLVCDNITINNAFVEKLDIDSIESLTPVNVPELIDQTIFTEKLIDLWNREISRIKRTESKKRALMLLRGEVEETGKESEAVKTEEESPEERVET